METENGVTLPAEFVDFLRRANGATLERAQFSAGGRERLIERVLCLISDYDAEPERAPYDIRVTLAQIGERITDEPDRPGSRVIPFGALFAGDYVCLDLRALNPSVVVWDHERSDEFAPALVPVAPSFASFEAMLHS